MRIYLAAILVGNLVWESLQLPLYTIWREGTLREQAFAVLHCTGGDLLIAASALMPVLPGLGTGVSPLLQWAIVPWIALWCARRASARISN